MATGRRDYTLGVFQETVTVRRFGSPFCDYKDDFLLPGQTKTVYTYTVPDGYRFLLNCVFVSSVDPALILLTVRKDIATIIYTSFSFKYEFNPGSYGGVLYDEGESVNIFLTNTGQFALATAITVTGLLEEKE